VSRIPDDVLEAIRQAVDITDLIGRYVPLKRSGKGFKGCCPFHDEKTPSFHVWAETGTWKCFGCDKGGNLFGFLMEREGLTFPEAARQLAKDAGIEIEAESPEAVARAGHLARLRDLHEWTCRYFEAALRGPRGEPARDYFKRRGIRGETARDFRLGFAPPGWDNLLRAAGEFGWSEDELDEAGLIIRREDDGRRKVYDRFRDRVVFPICDPQGRVIAFGARTLGDGEPKYLNSPETPLYTKGRHLYALHLAKHAMLKTGEGAVMEGYTDVLLAHQEGWPVAVAGLGTALTRQQAQRLSRYVKKLWLVYDGDAAGQRAAEKAVPEFLSEEIETRVALLTGGKDPADLIVDGGVAALRERLDAAPEAFEHLIAASSRDHDVSTVPGRAAATEAVVEALVGVGDTIRRSLYVKRLADAYGVPEDAVAEKLSGLVKRQAARESRSAVQRPARRPPPPAAAPASGPLDPDGPPLEAYAGALAGSDEEIVELVDAPPPPQRTEAPMLPVERLLLEALVGCPALLAEVPEAGTEILSHPAAMELLSHLLAAMDEAGGSLEDGARAVASIQEPELQALAAELIASGLEKNLEQQGRDCLRRLEDDWHRRQVRDRVDAAASEEEELDALRALQELLSAQHGRDKE
jgi:DNA primase